MGCSSGKAYYHYDVACSTPQNQTPKQKQDPAQELRKRRLRDRNYSNAETALRREMLLGGEIIYATKSGRDLYKL